MLQKNKINRIIFFNLFIFFFSIYLLTAAGMNFYHMDAGQLRFQVVQSIVERSNITVPEGLMAVEGQYYSWKGIGSVLLAIPFYLFGKLIGIPAVAVSIMNQFFGAATTVLVFLFSISLGYSRRASLLVSIFYGLGTMAWPLAKQPFDNIIETFFILLSVYFVYLYVINKKVYHLLLSSISLGFAFIIRPISILVIPALFILNCISLSKQYCYKDIIKPMIKNIALFTVALMPFIGIFFWYNYSRFGSVFETGYNLIAVHAGIDLFSGTSVMRGLSGFLVSPGKGFFYYSPVAILFFLSIKAFMKRHSGLAISFVYIMLAYPLFLSKYIYWHGDWAWGPRYLLVLTPFIIIPIAELIESHIWLKKKGMRLVVYSILTISLIIQIAAVSVDFQRYFNELIYAEKVEFTEAHGKGLLPIVEPPDEIYFDWYRSPILTQFKFFYKMAKEIKDYRYLDLPDNVRRSEKIMASPYMNVYDFWWLHEYYLYGNTWGFTTASVLFLIAIYTALRLWKLTSMSPQDIRLCVEESKRK